MKKYVITIVLLLVVAGIFLQFIRPKYFKTIVEIRSECLREYNNPIEAQRHKFECYNYVCNRLDMTTASTASWFYPTTDCVNKDGITIEVGYSEVTAKECKERLVDLRNLVNCITSQGGY